MTTGKTTLGDVRDIVRQRADMVYSTFCSDAELNGYISSSYKELYDILVTHYGENYYAASSWSFRTNGSSEFHNLPTDFYKLLGVDLMLDGDVDYSFDCTRSGSANSGTFSLTGEYSGAAECSIVVTTIDGEGFSLVVDGYAMGIDRIDFPAPSSIYAVGNSIDLGAYVAADPSYTGPSLSGLFLWTSPYNDDGSSFEADESYSFSTDVGGGTASGTTFRTLAPFNFGERNAFSVLNTQPVYGMTNLRYRVQGDRLWLSPLPAAGQIIRLWYVPRPSALTADADEIDGVSGWEEYIITDAVIKAKSKEESDISVEAGQKAALLRRIEAAAANRDAGRPATVVDSRRSDQMWPWSPNSDGGWGWSY